MASILLWAGIALIVAGWLALSWQAAKIMRLRNKLERLPEKKNALQLQRNYCRLTICAGIALIIISLAI